MCVVHFWFIKSIISNLLLSQNMMVSAIARKRYFLLLLLLPPPPPVSFSHFLVQHEFVSVTISISILPMFLYTVFEVQNGTAQIKIAFQLPGQCIQFVSVLIVPCYKRLYRIIISQCNRGKKSTVTVDRNLFQLYI